MKENFVKGLKAGLPIFLGYLPVAFTFGFLAVSGGLPIWLAVFISMSNLTSAGQFAGTNLILFGSGFLEIGLTTLVINLRYTLMSLSLSQKIPNSTPTWKRLLFSFGITDETFVVASMQKGKISAGFMAGLILLPFIGWSTGTLLGGCVSQFLPLALQNAMGIALYGMFIALIVPAAKESKKVLLVIIMAITLSCVIKYVPALHFISSGFRIIIATILAAGVGAVIFPEEPEVSNNES